MRPDEFAKNMTYMLQAYGKEMGEEQMTVWFNFFETEDEESFRKAIVRMIPRCKFMPSIAEIKEEIANIKNPELQLKPEEEWDKITRAIHKYGIYNAEEAEKSLDPYTRMVLKHMGGFRKLCMMEDDDWPRKNFLSLWKEMREAGVNVRVIEEPLLTTEELLHLSMVRTDSLLIEKKDPEAEEEHRGKSAFDDALARIRKMYYEKEGKR